jgi:hypothetical protein
LDFKQSRQDFWRGWSKLNNTSLEKHLGSNQLFSGVKVDAARLSKRAYDVMNASYGGSVTNIPRAARTIG